VSCDQRKAELLALIASSPSPARAQHRARTLVAAAGALGIAIGLFLALGGVRLGGELTGDLALARPVPLILATSIGAAVLAVAALWGLVHRGGSMLGRPRGWLLVFSLLVVSSLLAWKLLASSVFPDMTLAWPTRPGLRCIGVSLLLGIWPLAALSLARARGDAVHPRSTGAALGVAAGACTWLLVDLWCPVAHPTHLLLGHVLPIAVLALAGAWIGSRWIALARS